MLWRAGDRGQGSIHRTTSWSRKKVASTKCQKPRLKLLREDLELQGSRVRVLNGGNWEREEGRTGGI